MLGEASLAVVGLGEGRVVNAVVSLRDIVCMAVGMGDGGIFASGLAWQPTSRSRSVMKMQNTNIYFMAAAFKNVTVLVMILS